MVLANVWQSLFLHFVDPGAFVPSFSLFGLIQFTWIEIPLCFVAALLGRIIANCQLA